MRDIPYSCISQDFSEISQWTSCITYLLDDGSLLDNTGSGDGVLGGGRDNGGGSSICCRGSISGNGGGGDGGGSGISGGDGGVGVPGIGQGGGVCQTSVGSRGDDASGGRGEDGAKNDLYDVEDVRVERERERRERSRSR